jgi:hypothetical protein
MAKLDELHGYESTADVARSTKFADPDLDARPGLRDPEALVADLTRTAPAAPPKIDSTRPAPALSATPAFYETLIGALALVAWVCFFGAGILVSTKPLRDAFWGTAPLSFFTRFGYLLVTVCCYTVTNLFFLSCISAFLGCMACRWQVNPAPAAGGEAKPDPSAGAPAHRLYAAALLRGFLLYTFVISGLLVMSTEASVIDTNPAQYVRLGGFVSAIAFIVGYDPQLINRFISKVNEVGNLPLGRK